MRQDHGVDQVQFPLGNSLAVQWLGLCPFIAEGPGFILVGKLRSHKLCAHHPPQKKKSSIPSLYT